MTQNEVIHLKSLGQPAELAPLSDADLTLICSGLLLPNQGAAKSMARELQKLRSAQVAMGDEDRKTR